MRKLAAVEDAKALMREAMDWSMWGWLTRKPTLRRAADAAWEALEAAWSDCQKRSKTDLKKAEKEWRSAREIAEATFDEAERCMSTSMACEGARQAIEAWELTEKAIRRAQALYKA